MGGGEGRRGDVLGYGFRVGPDAGAFFAGDVLDDFVEDGGEDEGAGFGFGGGGIRRGGVAFVGEVGADGYEEGTALGELAMPKRLKHQQERIYSQVPPPHPTP